MWIRSSTNTHPHPHTDTHFRHCFNMLKPTAGKDPLMRPLTSCMYALFHHASRLLHTYIIHVNAAWMPLTSQLNVIPLPLHHCEKHSRSAPFVPFQERGNVDLFCITNAFLYSLCDPAQQWIGCGHSSQFTILLPFVLLLRLLILPEVRQILFNWLKNKFNLIFDDISKSIFMPDINGSLQTVHYSVSSWLLSFLFLAPQILNILLFLCLCASYFSGGPT